MTGRYGSQIMAARSVTTQQASHAGHLSGVVKICFGRHAV